MVTVPEDVYPVQWTGRQALVALPEDIDVSNAGAIREELLSVINRGAEVLIVDMTATISCDHAGADAVARAYQRAVASRTELRLAVTSGDVLRMLGMTGVGRLVPVYPSAQAASAARSPAASAARLAADARQGSGSRRSRMTGASPGGSVHPGTDVGVEVALLDLDGVIAWVNQAWQAFAAANGGDPARTGRGVSYLQACASAGDDPVAQEVAAAIRAALAGDLPGPLTVEVPCHSPATERLFDVLIASRQDDHGRRLGATVTLSLARSQPRPRGASPRRGLTLARGPHRPPQAGGQPAAAAVMTPGVLWSMLEAFNDGVALADREGTLVLASRRLAEMFGYQHTELAGQPVERLIPAHLQAARTRPVGTGALLTGLHKDGTTFPVELSLSPVRTTAGRFSLAVVRDMTEVRSLADVDAAQRVRGSQELLDSVITRLYQVGISLQTAAGLPCDSAGPHIQEALQTLDDTISQIRESTFAGHEDQGR
jgi:anti-anti-sigma factor